MAALGHDLEDTARSLNRAADGYTEADGSFSDHLGLLGDYALMSWLAFPAATNAVAVAAGLHVPGLSEAGTAADRALIGILAHDSQLAEGITGVLPELVGGLTLSPGLDTGYELAQRLGTWAGVAGQVIGGQPWYHDGGAADVPPDPGAGIAVAPPAGVAELITRIPRSSERDPAIRIERVDGMHGRHWIVTIPGTAGLQATGGTSPFDGAGAAGVAARQRTAGIDAVEKAMHRVKIGPGEPVLLAGHSQGGMIAAAMASDRAITAEFTISHVVTAGAPIGEAPIPGAVQVLSIEHSDDLIAKLDSAQNPDRGNWTTVSAPAPGAHDDPLRAHDLTGYERTAALVDASPDASIRAWTSGAQGFLAGPDGTATSWTIPVRRAVEGPA